MAIINYEHVKEKQRIGNLFSALCPGMGLIYHSKWASGLVHIVIHLILGFLTIKNYILLSAYAIDPNQVNSFMLVLISSGLTLLNWLLSLANTNAAGKNLS